MARIKRLEKLVPSIAGFVTLALVVVLQLADPAPLERIRLQAFDAYQSASPRQATTKDAVAIVDIDEESIERLGQWPWPRTDIAELTRQLGDAGAAAIVFDIAFSEADRTSPSEVVARYQQLGRGEAIDGGFANLPSHDALLAESFTHAPVVTGFFLDKDRRGRDVEPKATFTLHGTLPERHVRSYAGSLQPLPELEAAATGNGFISLESDVDGIVRRVPLVAIQRGILIPSLSLEAVRVARGGGSPDLLASDGSGGNSSAPGAAVSVRLDGIEIPVNDAGEMWIHFPESGSYNMLPAWPIVSGKMAERTLAEAVAGKVVFIGGSAVGLQDLVSTPLSERIAGVTVHAAAVEQILAGDFLERPDWAFGLELILVVVLGLIIALLIPRLPAAKGALLALLGTGLIVAGSWFAFTRSSFLLDPTYPVLALLTIYAVQTVIVFYREERQRSYIHSAFDRYLPPEIVRQIAADPGRLELGGEERDMSVLMCDIRGFSRISERYSPREVIDFLIEFLTPMSELLISSGATIDKYIGDAILAFWNAPLDDPDHHRNAALAALAMMAKVDELNTIMPGRKDAVWPGEVKIGIGINSGLCCVGNMGSRQRLSYSLIGDTVNVAARLEGMTKLYGVPIVAGSTLAEQLDGFALLELDWVRVVGRDAPETIFALVGDERVREHRSFTKLTAVHTAMLTAYRAQDWETAQSLLIGGAAEYAAFNFCGLQNLFRNRITRLSQLTLNESWDGVFQALDK